MNRTMTTVNRPTRHTHRKMTIVLYSMMIPGLVYLFVNNYIPMAGLVLAFKRYNYSLGMWKSPWAGLSNFTYLFKTQDAINITRNTLLYNLVFIFLGNLLAVVVAIMLNFLRGNLNKKIYQTLILIPYLISMVVVSYIVYGFLSQENGFINRAIESLGGKSISWYTTSKYWPFILTIVYLWKSFGYSSIIYYATVIGIDSSLYEAAAIDGAGTWQQVRNVTLPGLKGTIATLVLLAIGRIFYSDFGLFYQVPMRSGLIANATDTIDVYVYKALTQLNDIGRASAAGFIQSVVGFVLILTVNLTVRKVNEENALF
ncbi:MAG: ABC transporter permease subunit [Roseburia faecis]|nr:ABC transporter permease subunit [Lachnospiraceae bacterium]MDY6279005.1 ABC transporter permease subunit [Roseburia faecis]